MAPKNCKVCGELIEYPESAQKYCIECKRLLKNGIMRRVLINAKSTPVDDDDPKGPRFRKAKCPRCKKIHASVGDYTGNTMPWIPCNECKRYFQEHSEQTIYEVML